MFDLQKQYFAFNIWDMDSIQAVINAAAACNCGVILQTSSRVAKSMELRSIRYFVSDYAERSHVYAYLHLDHCKELQLIRRVIDAGWDSVMFDGSDLPLYKNIVLTNQVCTYAHRFGVCVEAEVGQIPGTEEDMIDSEEIVARPEDIRAFLAQTDIDWLAAAIGTCHGLYHAEPKIHYDLLEEILSITEKPFVVHGGSGLAEQDFVRLLSYQGVKKINISTELKQAYRTGILRVWQEGLLAAEEFETLPVKETIISAVMTAAQKRMQLLNLKNEKE